MTTATLTVLVVDDEALARLRLKTLLADMLAPRCAPVLEAGDAMQAMALLRHHAVDALLLDIRMPGADGLQLAREMRTIAPEVAVIFVTAHAEHAVDAFELDVTDYLTKPVRADRLQLALQKALLKKERHVQQIKGLAADLSQKVVLIQERGRTERVPLSDVLYFKAELKYITVRTALRSYILDGSLSELEEQHRVDFLRIHRNTLVSRREMRSLERFQGVDEDDPQGAVMEGWALRLRRCEEPLLVSRRQLASVRQQIAQT